MNSLIPYYETKRYGLPMYFEQKGIEQISQLISMCFVYFKKLHQVLVVFFVY